MGVVAYYLTVPDSKDFMFRDDSALQKCARCGYRVDFAAHNPAYKLRKTKSDLYTTYDGQTIVSKHFRDFCTKQKYPKLRFLPFDDDPAHFHLVVDRVVPFDAARRETRFERLCPECGNYECVIGLTPPYLRVSRALRDGVYRSDLVFACGNEKSAAIFVAPETKEKMQDAGIRGPYYEEAEGCARGPEGGKRVGGRKKGREGGKRVGD